MARRLARVVAAFFALILARPATAQATNVLLVIADDLGVDRVGAYHEVPDPGHTPVIDGLAASGLLFRNAWSTPLCSPTRASILTGQNPYRHGVGDALFPTADTYQLWSGETTLPKVLPSAVTSLAIGKWHLALGPQPKLDLGNPYLHPLACGFAHFRGTMVVLQPFNYGDGYYKWTKNVDGVASQCTSYNTSDIVDDTLELIGSTPEPWFTWLAFNAPHTPFHKPPAGLHTFNLPPQVQDDPALHAKAAIEAMDTELGRLLACMDPGVLSRTLIIFIGDNGTDGLAVTPPGLPSQAKGTVYQGGVHVPMIVKGPGVAPGAECAGLVSTTDLFATIADVFGAEHATGLDSHSLLPYFADPGQPSLRPVVFTEWFDFPGFPPYRKHHVAVRGAQYKLIRTVDLAVTTMHLFDLLADPLEANDLLLAPLSSEAQAAYDALLGELAPPLETWNEAGLGLPGTGGEPRLHGSGELLPGTSVSLVLEQAPASVAAALFVGTAWDPIYFAGGVIGPAMDLTVAGLFTDGAGRLELGGSWPPGFPAGTLLVMQAWLKSHSGPNGFVASNTLVVSTP